MHIIKSLKLKQLFIASMLAAIFITLQFVQTEARAACFGTVHGLGPVVDPDRGKGVLSVRSGPSTKNKQITIMLNGEQAAVLQQKGKWFFVKTSYNIRGWVHGRFFSVNC